MIIDYDFPGYILPYLLSEGNSRYQDADYFPGEINYNTGLRIGLVSKSVEANFWRVGKIFFLAHDPDDLTVLEHPIPIVREVYDYGAIAENGLPSKQDKSAFFYVGTSQEEGGIEVSLDEENSKFIPRGKNSVRDREAIGKNIRQGAIDHLQGMARLLGLETALRAFFATYKDQAEDYIQYGDKDLIALIENAPPEAASWLDVEIPGDEFGTVRFELQRVLNAVFTYPTQEEITEAIAKVERGEGD